MLLEVKLAAVSEEKIKDVALKLWRDLYEEPFRGKERGRFCLTREQLKRALETERLHSSAIERLQDEALHLGLVIIDLDDRFPCVELTIARRYRRPPEEVFVKIFPEIDAEEASEGDDED
ncbi:MAG TPA: hypothetical protein VFC56_06550 [Stellaceae bacterium]|nr:hypothetical protein [Stellaceae bacterium]